MEREQFNCYLNQKIDELPESRTREAMRYSLLAGGKRIRPMLLYMVLQGYGKEEAMGDEFACALEMIHTYSLIHDDLPAMDNDDLRRGKPTCHKQFDEATAILAGDGLLTYAFQVASSSDTDPSLVRKCISVLAEMAGGMVFGQTLDISEKADMSWEDLQKVHRYKTGCLLSAPLMMGAVLAGRSEKEVSKWHAIGDMLGLAFQVQDDLLDAECSSEELGKSNSDVRNDKVTSVSLLGIQGAEAEMNALYEREREEISSLQGFEESVLLKYIGEIQQRKR